MLRLIHKPNVDWMRLRTIFFVVFAANVLLMLVSLVILPDRVAIHSCDDVEVCRADDGDHSARSNR